VEAVSRLRRGLLVSVVALGCLAPMADGHVLDEYLQATLVVIEPGDIRLRINLTPGVEIAEQVLKPIDQNRDEEITQDEIAVYAEKLKRDLTVRLDSRAVDLKVTATNVPEMADLRTGHGIIQVEYSLTPSKLSGGLHHLTFENRHFAALGVYLFNAARPESAAIRVVKQNRNANQSNGEIEFALETQRTSDARTMGMLTAGLIAVAGMLAVVWRWRVKAMKPTT